MSRFFEFETFGKSLSCCRTILEQPGEQRIYTPAQLPKKDLLAQGKVSNQRSNDVLLH
jgi:hypothetical protein